MWGCAKLETTASVFKTSRLSSGTPGFETLSQSSETIAWVSEMLWRTAGPSTFEFAASSVWRQKVNNRRVEGRNEGTYLEDATNPTEI